MTTIIRPIKKADNADLAQIIRGVFDEHNTPQQGTVYCDSSTDALFELFQNPQSILWVASLNNKAIGCCGIYPTNKLPHRCAELVKFYLHQSARGEGIGKQLLDKSIQSAKDLGYTQLYLECFPQFTKAIRMYQNQGFQPLCEPLGKSGHTACSIWVIKRL